MAQRSQLRARAPLGATPHSDRIERSAPPEAAPAPATGGFAELMARATEEILAVTYWFEPATRPEPYPVTVRFTGRRTDVEGRPQPGDQFVHEETITSVVPGSGPVSLTARIHGINAGEWAVTAREVSSDAPRTAPRTRHERRARMRQTQANPAPTETAPETRPLGPVLRFWRRWAPPVGPTDSADAVAATNFPLFARAPGILPGIWGVLVILGIILALVVQLVVIATDRLVLGQIWPVWVVAITAGTAGGKIWYGVQHRRERAWDGWCIQGFVLGATLGAGLMLALLRVPAGTFLDAAAPGLLLAMSLGRVGCFFAGCCGGPATASRWGVWCSDQRVGARRVPTQLMESALALTVGLVGLVVVLGRGPAGGALFVASLAAYTLGRQGILRLRAEPRKTRYGTLITAVVSAVVLLVSVVLVVTVG